LKYIEKENYFFPQGEILLHPPFPKAEACLLPLTKGGREGFEENFETAELKPAIRNLLSKIP
jgi:hypothetical protein